MLFKFNFKINYSDLKIYFQILIVMYNNETDLYHLNVMENYENE